MTTYHLLQITVLVLVIWQGTIQWRMLSLCWSSGDRRKLPRRSSATARSPTERPPCPGCAAEATQPAQSPPAPPPRIEHRRGRRRSVDTSRHYCPKPSEGGRWKSADPRR
jgi:hypothetical protein